MKILSLPKHENLTTGEKYGNFSSFPQYFHYISNFKSPITYKFVKCGCSNYFFFNSANLICRSTDISKYFSVSLGIRDNESRLYITITFSITHPLPKGHFLQTFCITFCSCITICVIKAFSVNLNLNKEQTKITECYINIIKIVSKPKNLQN